MIVAASGKNIKEKIVRRNVKNLWHFDRTELGKIFNLKAGIEKQKFEGIFSMPCAKPTFNHFEYSTNSRELFAASKTLGKEGKFAAATCSIFQW